MELLYIYSFLLFLVVCLTCVNPLVVPPQMRTFPGPEITLRDQPAASRDLDVQTFFYEQRLDHFNFYPQSFKTFNQRYMVNSKFWGGANSSSPILVYLGAEAPLDDFPANIGFMSDNAPAPHFKALLVYIEHRFYGESVPVYASNAEALWDAREWGPLTSSQAIADFAMVIMHIKAAYQAPMSPVIVIGASYGGMLAAWFRLKYPHIAIGALASSAPLMYFEGITPPNSYYDIVTRDFKEASETCYEAILNSWSEIDRVASLPNGLTILSQKFNTCVPLVESADLVRFLEKMYVGAAQYDFPPRYPVNVICKGINKAAFGTDILSKIYGGVVAYKGAETCQVNGLNNTPKPLGTPEEVGAFEAYQWQQCTELVTPLSKGNQSMFQPKAYDFEEASTFCMARYGVPLPAAPPYWISTFYGGLNTSLALKMIGSNIIFSNGLRDPYSSGGILKDLSDSLIAIYTTNGAHCLDLYPAKRTDPKWLRHQRRKEVRIVHGWLTDYYAKLNITNGSGSKRFCYHVFFVVLVLGHFGANFLF